MPSIFMLLAALLLCASGAPVEDESVAGDSSGEERGEAEMLTVKPFDKWLLLIDSTKQNLKAFEREFQNLENRDQVVHSHTPPSIPKSCNITKFRKEACLLRLARGLLIYSVYLKQAEKEYPRSLNFSNAQSNIGSLIDLASMVKQKMKNSNQATPPTKSEEAQLLKEVNSPDPYRRKLNAYSILTSLNEFLIEGKRSSCNMEMQMNQSADTNC